MFHLFRWHRAPWQIWRAPSKQSDRQDNTGLQVDVRLYGAFVATCSVVEGSMLDHVVQTDTAQRLSEFLAARSISFAVIPLRSRASS